MLPKELGLRAIEGGTATSEGCRRSHLEGFFVRFLCRYLAVLQYPLLLLLLLTASHCYVLMFLLHHVFKARQGWGDSDRAALLLLERVAVGMLRGLLKETPS